MDASTKAINYISIILGGILGAAVGWIIYQKTIARARELEIAELEAGTLPGGERAVIGGPPGHGNGRSYSDVGGAADDADAAALMNDDDISLWDNDERAVEYRDDFTDDDGDNEDPFSKGDRDVTGSNDVAPPTRSEH